MTATGPDDLWRGTSDARAIAMVRAQSSPAQRLAWLEDSLSLASSSGAVAHDRSRRQRVADTWAAWPT